MSKGVVWITRSQPGADKSGAAWQEAGFETLICPVISIAPPQTMPPVLNGNEILVVTSQNALRMLGKLTDRPSWPVLAVGDATAELARAMGFSAVESASGNAEDLLNLIQSKYAQDTREFVHISGQTVRVDLVTQLKALGLRARRDIYYQNRPISLHPDLDFGLISNVAIYSPMAARQVRGFAERLKQARTISISPISDAALGTTFRGRRRVAERPEESAMIKALSS